MYSENFCSLSNEIMSIYNFKNVNFQYVSIPIRVYNSGISDSYKGIYVQKWSKQCRSTLDTIKCIGNRDLSYFQKK